MCLKVCLGTHQWPHSFVLYKSIQGVYLHTFVYQGFTNSIEGEIQVMLGGFFYQVVGTWEGVILTIWTFFKSKKTVNSKHWLKSKLEWSQHTKSMKLK